MYMYCQVLVGRLYGEEISGNNSLEGPFLSPFATCISEETHHNGSWP